MRDPFDGIPSNVVTLSIAGNKQDASTIILHTKPGDDAYDGPGAWMLCQGLVSMQKNRPEQDIPRIITT